MPEFLTVREAARRTGKSPSSIRRVIYPIIQSDKHADRAHIQPSVEEVLKLRMKGDNFAWRLSEELLRREVPVAAVPERETAASPPPGSVHDSRELLTMLRGELDIKNRQITQQGELIAKQMELINGLSERLREGNILIGSLQQRLTLPDGKDRGKTEAIEAENCVTPPTEKGSEPVAKAQKPKGSFLYRLFR